MKIGFACDWYKVPEETWSGIPWRLRCALARQVDVADLGVRYSWEQLLLKYMHPVRHDGGWHTTYKWSSHWDKLVQRKLQSSLSKTPVDSVVEIGDLARLNVPYYLYQDLSYDVLERFYDPGADFLGLPGISLDIIQRRRERQHNIYQSAAGIFAMSEWFADTLVEWSGVPSSKVTVVYAGLNSVGATTEKAGKSDNSIAAKEDAKLLFVGRDFFRKGGDIVLKAFAQLRRDHSAHIRLTVVGPDRWPLPGGIPEGVVFLGSLANAQVGRLYREHSLFVMPSRFEAFGIAFVEALAHGIPVIGRSSFAMPEIIRPGENGALVHSDNPSELASVITDVLGDPAIRRRTLQAMQEVRTQYSWDSVAEKMVTHMSS